MGELQYAYPELLAMTALLNERSGERRATGYFTYKADA
jgi:hypothetical protein